MRDRHEGTKVGSTLVTDLKMFITWNMAGLKKPQGQRSESETLFVYFFLYKRINFKIAKARARDQTVLKNIYFKC